MPKYQYRCEKCEQEFEVTQSIHDKPLSDCPTCKGEIYRVISSNVGIAFKGTGFHKNDYSKKNDTKPACDKAPQCSGCDKAK